MKDYISCAIRYKWIDRINNILRQCLFHRIYQKHILQYNNSIAIHLKNDGTAEFGGDTDLLKAVAAGVCDITLANTYYFGRLGQSENAKDREVYNKVALFWPNQAEGERGAHVNVSGIGLTASATNIDNAKLLVEYLTNHESQVWYADVNNEYPVVEGVAPPKSLQPFGEFKADSMSLSVLGDNNRQAVEMMDAAGWK